MPTDPLDQMQRLGTTAPASVMPIATPEPFDQSEAPLDATQQPMAGGMEISEDEIRILLAKIQNARDELELQRTERDKARNAYFRQPLGNERDGRSRVVASDVFNHVESAHPHLMRQFLATDHKIAITGPEDGIAKALKSICREAIHDQGGFRLMSDVLKDGEISGNGSAKVWWSRVWGPTEIREIPELNEQDLVAIDKDVRFRITRLDPNPIRQVSVDDGIPDPVTGMTRTFTVEGAPTWSATLEFTPLEESAPVIAALPPEELICERGKVRINDRKGVGHRTIVEAGVLIRENDRLSMPGAPSYYSNLRRAIDAGKTDGQSKEDQERRDRESLAFDVTSLSDFGPWTEGDLRKSCEVIEWSDWVAYQGKLIAATVTFCNEVPIRCESNEDGIVPICTWSPIVNPHSIYGQSLAWLHADDQNLRTVLYRALLDSVAFSIDRPWLVKSRGTDMLALSQLVPGQVVFGSDQDATAIQIEPIDPRLFQILEYIKSEGEERGPGTRYNQGVDSDSLNKTATGIQLIQRASFSKIEMIAMAFAELFLVDLYNKLIFLFQHNLDMPKELVVDGKKVRLTREMIQGDYRARADMGLQVDFDDREYSKSVSLGQMMLKVSERFPMLFPLKAVYEHFKDVYVSAGKRDVQNFIVPPPPQMEGWFPGMPAPQAGPGDKTQGKPAAPGAARPQPGNGPKIQPPIQMQRNTMQPDTVSGNATSQPDESIFGK